MASLRRMSPGAKIARIGRLKFESLESRTVLSAHPCSAGIVPPSGEESFSAAQETSTLALGAQSETKNVLFIRGSSGSAGFTDEGGDNNLSDITNHQTTPQNFGWGTLADLLTAAGYSLQQVVEGPTPDGSGAAVPLSTMNLGQYDVIVFGSNNASYTAADVASFKQYVLSGGGAFFISDANFGSDWADAANSDQQFLDVIGVEVHQDQSAYVVGDLPGEIRQPAHPVLAGYGPGEVVAQFDGEGVSPFHIKQTVVGAGVMLLAGAEQTTRLNEPPFGPQNQGPSVTVSARDASLFTATYGQGRVAGHFDRNTFFNLNGGGTDITHNDHQQYALNLFRWLATGANLLGDYDQNDLVNQTDLQAWKLNYGSAADLNADGDDSGSVDGPDFLVWQRRADAASSMTTAVPARAAPSAEAPAVTFPQSIDLSRHTRPLFRPLAATPSEFELIGRFQSAGESNDVSMASNCQERDPHTITLRRQTMLQASGVWSLDEAFAALGTDPTNQGPAP